MVPIYKKDDVDSYDGFKSISLMSLLMKVFEAIINQRQTGFLEKHEVLVDQQHGYSKGLAIYTEVWRV